MMRLKTYKRAIAQYIPLSLCPHSMLSVLAHLRHWHTMHASVLR